MKSSTKTNVKNGLPPAVDLKLLNIVLLLIGFVGLFSSNPLESAFAIFQLFVLLKSYWRQNLPPVVLLLFLVPWLEINAAILEANLIGETLNEMLHGSGTRAYWISSLGFMAVHLGFYRIFKKVRVPSFERLTSAAEALSFNKLIIAYLAIGPLTGIVAGFIGRGSGLYQFVTYLNEISLAILIVICLRQVILGQINRTFVAFLAAVLVVSFYSFFSEWRLLLFALFIAFGTLQVITTRTVMRVLVIGVIFGNVIFLWQGIKPLYRAYLTGQNSLTGGLISQSVNRSQSEALGKFFELTQQFYAGELEGATREDNIEINSEELLYSTLRRVGYLEFMALTLNNVPDRIPHEEGKLLKSNLSFALIPRILNPNKGVKDDGAKVEKYTQFVVSENSSFSLGHYVEYFIDFGSYWMMIALFIFGWIGGRIYRLCYSRSPDTNPLFLCGILYITLFQWGSYQNDAIWIYGLTFFGAICHLFLFRPIYSLIVNFTTNQ